MIELFSDTLHLEILNSLEYLYLNLKKFISFIILKYNHIYLYVSSYHIRLMIYFISNFQFLKINILNDLVAINYPEYLNRFKLIYNLFSISNIFNIFLITFIKLLQKIPSLTIFFNSIN